MGCVDCYGSASFQVIRAEEYKEPGDVIEWVHIRTHEYRPSYLEAISIFTKGKPNTEFLSLRRDDPASRDEIVAKLKAMGVEKVFGGMDEGMYYSTELNHYLGLPDNPLESRDLRRKKDVGGKASGIGIDTFKMENVDDTMTFVSGLDTEEIVVKFNAGAAGAKMLFLRRDAPDLRKTLQDLLDNNPVGPFGTEDYWIVQPRIVGREFFINTYTVNGVTYLTGIAEYFRIKWGDKSLYFVDTLLSLNSEEANQLLPLAAMVCKKHELKDGPAHIEFIQDAQTRRWYLLENNARVAGAGVPWLESKVYGISHLDIQVMRKLNRKRFEQALKKLRFFDPDRPELGIQGKGVDRTNGGLLFVMPTPHAGELTADGLKEIQSLETYFPLPEHAQPKPERVTRTTDQYTAPLVLHLYGGREEMKRDVKKAIQSLQSGRLIHFDMKAACQTQMAEAGQLYSTLHSAHSNVNWSAIPTSLLSP